MKIRLVQNYKYCRRKADGARAEKCRLYRRVVVERKGVFQ